LTGSVGLHHVFSKLRQSGYNNPVTNDMAVVSVEPLTHSFAVDLARSLLESKQVKVDDLATIAESIATEVDGIPFYIREVINRCQYQQLAIDTNVIQQMVRESLTDADNRWHMAHYLDRIGNYYGNDKSELVRSILDIVAAERSISTREIIDIMCGSVPDPISEQSIRELLTLLERDHYLIKDLQDLKYKFRYALIQRYWQFQRS
jgi:hypothetical protein